MFPVGAAVNSVPPRTRRTRVLESALKRGLSVDWAKLYDAITKPVPIATALVFSGSTSFLLFANGSTLDKLGLSQKVTEYRWLALLSGLSPLITRQKQKTSSLGRLRGLSGGNGRRSY